MGKKFIDLRDITHNPEQLSERDATAPLSAIEWVITTSVIMHNGIDGGVIGRRKKPHLYIAQALAENIVLDETPRHKIARAAIGAALYTRRRYLNGDFMVSARTNNAFEEPYNPTGKIPSAMEPSLLSVSRTLGLLASSFTNLSQDSMTTAEANNYRNWCGHVVNLPANPYDLLGDVIGE